MIATDIVLIITSLGVLITAIAGAFATLRRVDTSTAATMEKVDATTATVQGEIQAVHKIVNQQRTDMLAYQEKLVEALQRAGIHVPQDQSLK